MRRHLSSLLVLTALLTLAIAASAPARTATGPSANTVKKILAKHYTESARAYSSVRAAWKASGKITYGRSLVTSNYRKYGVAGRTRIFPVKLNSIYIACYSATGMVNIARISGKYIFFRDEFNAWTFRIMDESRTDPSRQHQPRGTPCPI